MSVTAGEVRSATLKVPGAQICYEVQGTGPVLLMIPGGPADAGTFARLAAELAAKYTTVRYDPRGNSRSIVEDPSLDQNMDQHGDDAAALIAALGGEPAFVLGSSGGAQIGLNLAARHPLRVRTLLAHEPPCVLLLPDVETIRAKTEEILAAYRTEGVGAGMQKFLAFVGLGQRKKKSDAPPTPEMQASFRRMQGNFEFFLAHGVKPISYYVPDAAALQAAKVRVVVGIGEDREGQLAWRCAEALAERLDVEPAMFPGGHGGFSDQPAAFARKLDEVFS